MTNTPTQDAATDAGCTIAWALLENPLDRPPFDQRAAFVRRAFSLLEHQIEDAAADPATFVRELRKTLENAVSDYQYDTRL